MYKRQGYDILISLTAIVSMLPLMFKQQAGLLEMVDTITVYILFLDYILRWMSYDYISKWSVSYTHLIPPL